MRISYKKELKILIVSKIHLLRWYYLYILNLNKTCFKRVKQTIVELFIN